MYCVFKLIKKKENEKVPDVSRHSKGPSSMSGIRQIPGQRRQS